jgi:hypothetical protein
MLTAIAVLIVSAVGGGLVGAYLTGTYPSDGICETCQEKSIEQQESYYYQAPVEDGDDYYPSESYGEEYPESDFVGEKEFN